MIGNIASAIDGKVAGLYGVEVFFFNQQIFFITTFAEGVHVWVFAEEQVVGGGQLFFFRKISVLLFYFKDLIEQIGLVIPCLLVINQAEIGETCLFVDVDVQDRKALFQFPQLFFQVINCFNRICLNTIFFGEVIRNPIGQMNEIIVLLQ